MVKMDHKAEIRYAVLVEGKSQRQVAKESGYSRNTVRKMLLDSDLPRYQLKEPRGKPVLGPYKKQLEAWVKEDKEKPKKQRRTTVRMYDLLKTEHNYGGAESTVRAYVGRLRRQAGQKVYIPLSYEPGETAQVDFGEAVVNIGGERVTVQLFVMWLGYSGALFVQAYPGQTQEVFFAGHAAAFEFLGGVPQEIWYDNLSNAVRKVLKGPKRVEQERFISLRTHYLFKAEFCNVRAGWEKGGVESRVGYVRRNWLIGAGEFESWAALNAYLRERCRQEQQRTLRGRSASIGERLSQEQTHFRPLPARPYACCKTVPVRANKLSLVTFATNRYSVPVAYAHEALTLRAYVDRIEISSGTAVIASHARCWQRQQDVLNPHHYLALLAQRPRAFGHAQAIREWRKEWPEIFDIYLARLQSQSEGSQATRLFIQMLELGQPHPEAVLAEALQQALDCHCFTVAGVQEILRRVTEPAAPRPAVLTAFPQLVNVQVRPPTLQQFNQLLPQLGGGVA